MTLFDDRPSFNIRPSAIRRFELNRTLDEIRQLGEDARLGDRRVLEQEMADLNMAAVSPELWELVQLAREPLPEEEGTLVASAFAGAPEFAPDPTVSTVGRRRRIRVRVDDHLVTGVHGEPLVSGYDTVVSALRERFTYTEREGTGNRRRSAVSASAAGTRVRARIGRMRSGTLRAGDVPRAERRRACRSASLAREGFADVARSHERMALPRQSESRCPAPET